MLKTRIKLRLKIKYDWTRIEKNEHDCLATGRLRKLRYLIIAACFGQLKYSDAQELLPTLGS